jgi:hypothetical protein
MPQPLSESRYVVNYGDGGDVIQNKFDCLKNAMTAAIFAFDTCDDCNCGSAALTPVKSTIGCLAGKGNITSFWIGCQFLGLSGTEGMMFPDRA